MCAVPFKLLNDQVTNINCSFHAFCQQRPAHLIAGLQMPKFGAVYQLKKGFSIYSSYCATYKLSVIRILPASEDTGLSE